MFCKKCGSVLSFSSEDRLCPICRRKKKYAQSDDDGFDYIEKSAYLFNLSKQSETVSCLQRKSRKKVKTEN